MELSSPRQMLCIDTERRYATLTSRESAGEKEAPRPVSPVPTMTANDDTPPSGESVSDASVDYQNLGQTLLSQELERHAYAVRQTFMEASAAVERGEDLDADDVSELEEQLRQAQFLVEDLREALD